MRLTLPILALALGLATPARADLTAYYAGAGRNAPTLTVSVEEAGQVRADAGPTSGPENRVVLITRRGVDYFSATDAHGPFVARAEDVYAVLDEVVGRALREGAPETLAALTNIRVEISEIGTETVAGRQGRVFRVSPIPPAASGSAQAAPVPSPSGEGGVSMSQPVEVVISDDPELAPLGREMARLLGTAGGLLRSILGADPAAISQLQELLGRGTLIRFGDAVRLESVSRADVADSVFVLPGPVLTRAQIRDRAPAMSGAGAQE